MQTLFLSLGLEFVESVGLDLRSVVKKSLKGEP